MTNLTDTDSYDDVAVPDNGEQVIAASNQAPPPAGEGPVRPGFQGLTNRTKWLRSVFAGSRTAKRFVIDPAQTEGSSVAGAVDANGDPEALVVKPRNVVGPRSLRYGNLNLRIQDTGRETRITADGIYGPNWAHDATLCNLAGARGTAELGQGGLKFSNLVAAADGGNPTRLTAVRNEVKANLLVKAWGIIVLNNGIVNPGANTIGTEGAGGWDLTLTANRVVITWQFEWADLSYALVTSGARYSAPPVPGLNVEEDLAARTKTQTSLIINQNFDQIGAAIDPRSITTAFTFYAMGRQKE